jgi:hypothetical protein
MKFGEAGTATRAGPVTVPSAVLGDPAGPGPTGLMGDWKSQFTGSGPAAIARDAMSSDPSTKGSKLISPSSLRTRVAVKLSLLTSVTPFSRAPQVLISKPGTF